MFAQRALTWCGGIVLLAALFSTIEGYALQRDIRLIGDQILGEGLNHARIARRLVHQATWAAVGTHSTDKRTLGYPMVNIISVDDSDRQGRSTGRIRFLLTDLDFTGIDWHVNNKVSFLFSDEEKLNCAHAHKDPMEPTCARTIISGQVVELNETTPDYVEALYAFKKRHPAARNWLQAHNFYLCELHIENIYVLDYYGGPHNVAPTDYYNNGGEQNSWPWLLSYELF